MINKITSLSNPLIKNLSSLIDKSKTRINSNTFLIEGVHEIKLAIKAGYSINKMFYCPKIYKQDFDWFASDIQLIQISNPIFQKLAYRKSTGGILALANSKKLEFEDLNIKDNSLILVFESIEKPGNIGAMLRTADAANVDAVIICDPITDLYNPNIIRSSLGCVFTNKIVIASAEKTISFLKEYDVKIYSATLQNSLSYCSQNYISSTAFVIGNETYGLSDKWRTAPCKNINIPMNGSVDSLNLSVTAAILLFEANRQRKKLDI